MNININLQQSYYVIAEHLGGDGTEPGPETRTARGGLYI